MMKIDPRAAIPPQSGSMKVRGAEKPVLIHRDRWGIPHVQAQTTADVFFGQGFAMAQDRLFQMEYDRLRAAGATARLMGSHALAWDVFARRARLPEAARLGYAALDAETRAMLVAHAAGINAFLDTCPARPVELQALGHQPERWQPSDAIAVFLARHITFATLGHKLFRARVVATLGAEALGWFRQEGAAEREVPLIIPPGAEETLRGLPLDAWTAETAAILALTDAMGLGGSNSWLLSGARTASGAPLMAGDPHRMLELPNVYVQIQLAGQEFDVVGLGFPGVPGVPHFGQTQHVAWCVTNAQAEYQDLFIEHFRCDGDLLLVETADGWVAAEVRQEEILVRDAPPRTINVITTPHGPVVIGDPASGVALALSSTGLLEPGGSIRAVLPMLRARSAAAVDAALTHWVEPANNFLIADRAGDIRYRTTGRIPRHREVNAWIPVPGWDGGHEWDGVIADTELPRCQNPPGGAIVTANQRIVDAAYPHVLGIDYANGNRARRIRERLAALQKATPEDFAAIHRDIVSLSCCALRDRIVNVDVSGLSGQAARICDQLALWDGKMARDAIEPALVAEARAQLVRVLANHQRFARLRISSFRDEPPQVWPLEIRIALALGTLFEHDAATVFGEGTTWQGLLREALEGAATALQGGPEIPWGDRHRPLFAHPLRGSSVLDSVLAPPAAALDGDLDCIFATGSAAGIFDATVVASTARYVFDLADRGAGGWVVPLGASGHPASPHFADQHRSWADGNLLPIVDDWPQLQREATATLQLRPGDLPDQD